MRQPLALFPIFETLLGRGYDGDYDAARRYARLWRRDRACTTIGAYVPLSFAPGEAYHCERSQEVVQLRDTTVTHVRLCLSRMLFVPVSIGSQKGL